MALPENRFTDPAVVGSFIGAAAEDITRSVDYEDGPVALNDPTEGLMYQVWTARSVNDEIIVSAPNTPEFVAYSAQGLSDVSIAFDQNGRLHYAYRELDNYYLYWYDTSLGMFATLDLGADVFTAKITLDDKRASQSGRSDIILAYVDTSIGEIRYRQQRDRFQIEYDPYATIPDLKPTNVVAIEKFGKADTNRLQFLISTED